MKHGRQTNVPYRGPRATPWKYYLCGKPIRRGKLYGVQMFDAFGVLLWKGNARG